MAFNLGTAIGSFAPTIATMLMGPMAGKAVSILAEAFGLAPDATQADITKVLQTGTMTPEIIAAVRAADQRHAEILGQQGIDLARLNADTETAQTVAIIDDRKDARKTNGARDAVWWIAMVILITFAAVMASVLWGCFQLITGGMPVKDPSVVAAVSGLIGAVVGYVAANAQTVVNFIYGGSLGSEKKTDALADSVKQAINTVGK